MSKLIILGSGTAVFHYPSGYLLQHNGKNHLIECSEGIRERLEKIKIDYYSIDTIFISHFHPDHFNLQTLIESIQVRNSRNRKLFKITVFGPPETEERFKTIWDACHFKGNYQKVIPKHVIIEFIEYKDKQPLTIGNFELTPFSVIHGHMPAFSLRFKIDGKIFSYSGDSGPCLGIEKASEKADFFLCEANEKIGDSNYGHLSPHQAGEIAKRNHVKNLILTHLTDVNSEKEIKEAVKKTGFKGKLQIAKDLQTIYL